MKKAPIKIIPSIVLSIAAFSTHAELLPATPEDSDGNASLSVEVRPLNSPGARPVQSTPFSKGTLFASEDGNGDCISEESPCNIFTAFSKLEPGSVLFIKGGTYSIVNNQLSPGKSGTRENPIIIESYPGETAVLEGAFKSQEDVNNNTRTKAIRLSKTDEYISIRKIEIKYMGFEGIAIFGSHNIVEGCHLHHNRLPGVTINGGEWRENVYAEYTRGYNIVRDNIVHDNSDVWFSANGGNADGIAVSSGKDNEVVYNTVYSNSDDGIDTWRSNNSYVAYNLTYDNGKAGGDGNGIKAGGNAEVAYDENNLSNGKWALVEHNISFKNKRRGFNFNSGKEVTFRYNTSWENGTYGFTSEDDTIVENNIAYESNPIEQKENHTGNSWQSEGSVAFISTDPSSHNFLRPTSGGGFEGMGAYTRTIDTPSTSIPAITPAVDTQTEETSTDTPSTTISSASNEDWTWNVGASITKDNNHTTINTYYYLITHKLPPL